MLDTSSAIQLLPSTSREFRFMFSSVTMGNKKLQSGQGQGHDDTEIRKLLIAAEYFLQNRNFAECCKYALRAANSDPTHPAPTRFLAIASVLSVLTISSNYHDYYTMLNLPYFESDFGRIGSGFKNLAAILDPKTNPYPFSAEAFDLVLKAYSVLTIAGEKARFDDELRRNLGTNCNGGLYTRNCTTFWTICPFCYYVYQYDKVLEDCCLRCANQGCRKVFHAVAMGAPPPPDMVRKGQYLCTQSLAPFASNNGNGGDEIGRRTLQTPFAYNSNGSGNEFATRALQMPFVNGGDEIGRRGLQTPFGDEITTRALQMLFANNNKGGDEIATWALQTLFANEGDEIATRAPFANNGNGEKPAIVAIDRIEKMKMKVEGETTNFHQNGDAQLGIVNIENSSTVKNVVRMKRRKSVPWNSNKLMGRGFRVDNNQAHFIYGVGEEEIQIQMHS